MDAPAAPEPLVFVGLPVFNGAAFFDAAINSLVSQTYPHWRLLISDNASTDGTDTASRHYARVDSRISYVQHSANLGALHNFRYVLDRADATYFMWAAADDVWHPEFLRELVGLLEENPAAGAAFCQINTIDSLGRIFRHYRSFMPFSSPPECHVTTVRNYLWAPEPHGKANLVYGVYRLQMLASPTKQLLSTTLAGVDMAFVLSFMCRHPYVVKDRVLFSKRHVRPCDDRENILPMDIPAWNSFDLDMSTALALAYSYCVASQGTRFRWTAVRIMFLRVIGTVVLLPAWLLTRISLRASRAWARAASSNRL